VTDGMHHDVVIEGTVWHPIEGAELARHIRRYVGEDHDLLHAATALAERIGHQVEAGHGDPIVLTEDERKVVYAVVNEWRQYLDIPDAVDPLYQLLHTP
jgi:hypothetical protein